jgi:hypothetical protein
MSSLQLKKSEEGHVYMPKVYIRSCRDGFGRDGNPALRAMPDGHVNSNAWGLAQGCEEWILRFVDGVPTPGATSCRVGIHSSQHWRYLSAHPNGTVRADIDKLDSCETWTLEQRANGRVAIKSVHGKYLCCDGGYVWNMVDVGNRVVADRSDVDLWEEWYITGDPFAFTNPGNTAGLAAQGTLASLGFIATVVSLAVPLCGFTTSGVVAGSAAAGLQSSVYGGATTGLFSVLQSVGATGAWIPTACMGAATTTTASVSLSLKRILLAKQRQSTCSAQLNDCGLIESTP